MARNWSDNEKNYKEALRSAAWDVGDGSAPRFQYVIFSLARTGSEFLCANLRKRGIGVPLEYFMASVMAEQLGCTDSKGQILLPQYLAQLRAKRTTSNGIFGVKLQPGHLRAMGGQDIGKAAYFLDLFDKVLVLRRRDTVLQAISLARAELTGQFHIVPGDVARSVQETDAVLFARIAAHLAGIMADELYVETVVARIEPSKVSSFWYEDLSDDVVESIAATLSGENRDATPTAAQRADHDLPQRGDTREAETIKKRFLVYITGHRQSAPDPVPPAAS